MRVLTAEQMREIDRRTIEAGVPSLILMENAACRFVEMIERWHAPLSRHRIVVICGKGNNGGDGLAIARQIVLRGGCASLDVVVPYPESQLSADAAANLQMLAVAGLTVSPRIEPSMRAATLVIDALLGTGLDGPARGLAAQLIEEINSGFPAAEVVSVDVPSGLHEEGISVRALRTVTFTAPKVEQVLPPLCDRVGELHVAAIGTPAWMLEKDAEFWLHLSEPAMFRRLFQPRPRGAHKGDFGHVLIVGGARGKGGAAAMAGLAALKMGSGLVTVATAQQERATVTALAPELMTQEVTDDPGERDVIAIGPGLGVEPELSALAQRLFLTSALPMVVDADGLNALAGTSFHGPGPWRVLTPHPGEMARLAGCTVTDIQADRLGLARKFAHERNVVLVLKGQRTIIAMPSGRAYINPTGNPGMATAGSGDILTGLIAGALAQWPERRELAVVAAVWLHGRAGDLCASAAGERPLTATSLLEYLPAAIREVERQ
jgi:NAD(P)H-hydrate epimerase